MQRVVVSTISFSLSLKAFPTNEHFPPSSLFQVREVKEPSPSRVYQPLLPEDIKKEAGHDCNHPLVAEAPDDSVVGLANRYVG